jgi:hypothetical protein
MEAPDIEFHLDMYRNWWKVTQPSTQEQMHEALDMLRDLYYDISEDQPGPDADRLLERVRQELQAVFERSESLGL